MNSFKQTASRLRPLAVPLILLLAACRPGVAEYTQSEAPNELTVDSATTAIDVHFVPGSDRLTAFETGRLRHLAATGAITPADRVLVSTTGSSALGDRQAAAISRDLLAYGIVSTHGLLGAVPRDHAIVEIERSVVTLPACPNWSKPSSGGDFSNAPSSNLGCATAMNLGLMIASPVDLARGRTLARADGQPAAAAVDRYLNDKIQLPTSSQISPIAATATPSAGAGNSTGSTQ